MQEKSGNTLTVCHLVCDFVSTTWIKQSDWLIVSSRCGILIYSACQGLMKLTPKKTVQKNAVIYRPVSDPKFKVSAK